MIRVPKGYHQGERCFIIASGPSAKNMDFSWLKNEITICVNQSYKLLDFEPTYICISDENLWSLIKDTYAKMNSKIIACFGEPQRFIDDYKGMNLRIMFKNLGRDPHPNKKYTFDLTEGVYSSKNVVPTVAIPFAHWCEFKSVYLVGCDCTNNGYAYEGGHRQDKQYFDDYTMEYYKLISEFDSKTCIYNATCGGNLNYFHRVDFDALKRPFMVIGYYTPYYKFLAERMKKSVIQFGVTCEIKEEEGYDIEDSKLQWAMNANICPFFIKQIREKYPDTDLFCIDADAQMLRRPDLFLDHPRDYDFGAVFIENKYQNIRQLCGGGLYFAATEKANDLLDRWTEIQKWRNEELLDGIYRLPCIFPQDQESLQTAYQIISELKWIELPHEYGYIESYSSKQIMPPVSNPVIIHSQESRIKRNNKNG